MKYPDKIRIAGHDYAVKTVHSDDAMEPSNLGRCDHHNLRITIETNGPEVGQRQTLLHELIHAADKRYGGNKLAEEQVLAMENGLWAIFRDNPGLAAFIFGK